MYSRRFLKTAAALAGLIVIGGVLSYAAIPDANGVIHGCYNTTNGTLRVIDNSVDTCKPAEASLNWDVTGAHHQELTFTIAPGGSQSFTIPKTLQPVRIEVTFSLLDGATQTPSEVMYAVVNQDPASSRFSWVGTNNDGSVQVGTSVPTGSFPLIAKICGGSFCPTNATLEVDNDSTVPGSLKLTTNANSISLPATFKVEMWF